MARTVLSQKRLTEIRRTNIGSIIIFCEGKSEKYYFDYFAEIIRESKYSRIEVVSEVAGGNARTVLNFANAYMLREENNRAFGTYCKYLAYDCDSPPDIQTVVLDSIGYGLLVSNYLFETWLLMHFEEVDAKLTKRQTYVKLSEHIHNSYRKGRRGITREIIQNGEIEKAIDNARRLEEGYDSEGKSVFSDINNMNPFTSEYKLVEQFVAEIS